MKPSLCLSAFGCKAADGKAKLCLDLCSNTVSAISFSMKAVLQPRLQHNSPDASKISEFVFFLSKNSCALSLLLSKLDTTLEKAT